MNGNTLIDPLELPSPPRQIQRSRVRTYDAVVVRMLQRTHDTFELVVKVEDDAEVFGASAGQFATLRVPGIQRPRSYSFAKSPENEVPGEYTFFIRQVDGGEMSAWLGEKDRTGEPLQISAPLGKFGVDESDKTMICIAGGSGMSAINALLEHAVKLQLPRDCYFFYGARSQRDLYCQEEMHAMKQAWHPQHTFEFVCVLSEEPQDSDWQGPRGFVTDYFKNNYLDTARVDARDSRVFFCGPPPMIDAGVSILSEAGLSSEHIYYDKFEDARSPAPVVDNRLCVLCDECLLVKPVDGCLVETSGLDLNEQGTISAYQRLQPADGSGLYYNSLYIDENECIRCYACIEACPHDAISPGYEKVPQTLRQTI